jgi:hypothetical protein
MNFNIKGHTFHEPLLRAFVQVEKYKLKTYQLFICVQGAMLAIYSVGVFTWKDYFKICEPF